MPFLSFLKTLIIKSQNTEEDEEKNSESHQITSPPVTFSLEGPIISRLSWIFLEFYFTYFE